MTAALFPRLTLPSSVCTWCDLQALCAEEGVCATVFLGSFQFHGQERLRVMLGEMDRYLHAGVMAKSERVALLDPLWHVLSHLDVEPGRVSTVWLRSQHSFLQFRLPWEEADRWMLEPRFHVWPLLRLMSPRRRFHLLVFEGEHAKLTSIGDGRSLPVLLRAIPMELVERSVSTLLRSKPWPLVVGGRMEELKQYVSLNSYADVLLMENPADDPIRQARGLIADWKSAEELAALGDLGDAGVEDVPEILRAAARGVVRHLFVPRNGNLPIRADLLNSAVVDTIRYGGRVWQVLDEGLRAVSL